MGLSKKQSVRSGSHVSSSVSVKSDWSKEGYPPNFSEKKTSSIKSVRSGSHVSRSVSLKSDWSKDRHSPNFSEKKTSSTKSVRSGSLVSSSVSVKSDWSKNGDPPNFSEKKTSSTKRLQYETLDADVQTPRSYNNFKDNLKWNFQQWKVNDLRPYVIPLIQAMEKACVT